MKDISRSDKLKLLRGHNEFLKAFVLCASIGTIMLSLILWVISLFAYPFLSILATIFLAFELYNLSQVESELIDWRKYA